MFIYNIYVNIYTLGTETEGIIVWLHPQALKRFLGVPHKTFLCVVFALRHNRTTPATLLAPKQSVRPGSTTSGFSAEHNAERAPCYPSTHFQGWIPTPPGRPWAFASCSFSRTPPPPPGKGVGAGRRRVAAEERWWAAAARRGRPRLRRAGGALTGRALYPAKGLTDLTFLSHRS